MTNIKKLNKQNRVPSMADVDGLVANVKRLEQAGLLTVNPAKCAAAFKLDCWKDRDGLFRDAWCNNILTYWCLMHEEVDRYKHVVTLYDIDNKGVKIGTFSLKTGFMPMEGFAITNDALLKVIPSAAFLKYQEEQSRKLK